MQGSDLRDSLINAGIHFGSGVPCSYFGNFFESVHNDKEFSYVAAANEGSAIAMASGHMLSGKKACVLMQNSGLGNAVNPLTSLCEPYKIAPLLFVSGRAFDGLKDEGQHRVMGTHLQDWLKLCQADIHLCPGNSEELDKLIAKALDASQKNNSLQAIIVQKGQFESFQSSPAEKNQLSRKLVVEKLSKQLTDQVVISTTGFLSRELFLLNDREKNFYMQGSMGHACAMGLGLALSGTPTIVLDGDGAALMHLGSLVNVGHAQPDRFLHIVVDNNSYESTGSQPTISSHIDFKEIAKSSGYKHIFEITTEDEFDTVLKKSLLSKESTFLLIRTNSSSGKDLPRISSKHSHEEITRRVQSALR